jgi:hypothetical protein
MIPYNIEIFSLPLGLEDPWFVEDMKFVDGKFLGHVLGQA